MTTVRRIDKLRNGARWLGGWLRRPQALPEKWLYRAGVLRSAGLRMPDFLGIGAQKAGTTWLHRNLAAHPDVWFPPGRKEIRFFDARFTMSVREYAALFEPAGARRTGDITPNYGALPPARIRFVHRLMPDAKLLLLLRNPVERAWSHAVMDLATVPGRALEEVPEWEFRAHFRSGSALRNGRYAHMLANWEGVFGPQALLVAFFEEIAAAPRELLLRVFAHLDLDPDVDWQAFPTAETIHPGPAAAVPEAFRGELQELFAHDIRAVAERFGGPAEHWR